MKEIDKGLGDLSSSEKRAILAQLLRKKAKTASSHSLTPGQEALWLLHQSAPESAAYNAAYAIRIRSPIDDSALRGAFQCLLSRHDSLHSTFFLQEGTPVRIIRERQELFFEPIDVSGWTQEQLIAQVAEHYQQPFDLERGPLMRVHLFTRSDQDHILLLVIHHIACDAWSIWILMHEFRQLYPVLRSGKKAALPPLERNYADFVQWQKEMTDGPEGERQWNYWKKQLAGEIPPLNLPTDRPYSPTPNYEGATHAFRLSADIVHRLYELAKSQGATLYMILLAAFQVLLHRYTDQDDITIGSPASGRSQPDFSGIVGYFVNPVVLRANLSGDPSFGDFLSQTRRIVLDALAHQDYSFPKIVERLHPQRDASHTPIFQTMFIMQKPPQSSEFAQLLTPGEACVNWGGLDLQPFELAQMEGQFDLTLEILEKAEMREALFGAIKYKTVLFDDSTIQRLERHFQNLLREIADHPKARLSELPILTETEKNKLIEWNHTRKDYALDRCLHDWVEDQAARTPDAAAVILLSTNEILTYAQLNACANRLAHYLRSLGVGAEALVGICAERSLDMVVGLLGILKAGGAYVPLDPGYPADRLAFMMSDCQAAILLKQKSISAEWIPDGTRIVHLDGDEEGLSHFPIANPSHHTVPENLAYVIYTSGSTGKPKGAKNTHKGVCNRLLWMQEAYPLDATDRVLQKTPFSFDVSVWEFFWPLMTGAGLVMAKPGGHQDNGYIANIIREQKITTLHFVPSMLRAFLEQPNLENCHSLRRVLCSGEALPSELVNLFYEKLPCELHNLYGPTEAAIDVAYYHCQKKCRQRTAPIGQPIAHTQIHILDRRLRPVPIGVSGELHIGGVGLARGYLNRPDMTAEKFIPDPFSEEPGARLYKTGDLTRRLADGNIEYLDRLDHQVKIRGFRIEIGEIESVLKQYDSIQDAIAAVRTERPNDPYLAAYFVSRETLTSTELRRFLKERLPDYMIPSAFVPLKIIPLTPNGKADRRALPAPESPHADQAANSVKPHSEMEQLIASIWQKLLHIESAGVHDNFFDIGGHSILLGQVLNELQKKIGRSLSMVEMFQYPTIYSLAKHLSPQEYPIASIIKTTREQNQDSDIAIVGLSCRYPGAKTIEEFWRNLREGVESISFFSDEELLSSGVEPEIFRNPNYVRASGVLEDIEQFDAAFFGYTPREAEILDVQHRLFLECAWEALEDCGCDPGVFPGAIGVYAGAGLNTYLLNNLYPHRELIQSLGGYQLMIANDKDYLAARVSYKLNLKGPSVTIQTTCSTSLAAVHFACQALRNSECDMALAGGVSVRTPHRTGYMHQEGMILSPDGHCRAFDAQAQGTVGGNGAGIAALKRLEDALADGDRIYAVIKGSVVNNDGALKAGFTAPSVDGQAAAIRAALQDAGIEAESIGYIETHGTGTILGDPIEIAALRQAFDATDSRKCFCAIGSVKTNIGHLDCAAGIAGLTKAALALHRREIPPSLHFHQPNPQIDFNNCPFYVNTQLSPWEEGPTPRRAGVSSFGIGGTNVHAILKEAPEPAHASPSRPYHLLLLSAKTESALSASSSNLAEHFAAHPEINIADAAYTLACGRKTFAHRRIAVCSSAQEAADALRQDGSKQVFTSTKEAKERPVVFMFSGQGSQYVNMAAEVYRCEPTFRERLDQCAEILRPQLHLDLRDILYPKKNPNEAAERLRQTAIAQPALFALEYALAELWMSWGVKPKAAIGHSLGEYAAAWLAGVFSLEDALALTAERGRMMQEQPGGAMLAVSLPEKELQPHLNGDVALAAVNAPNLCVLSGPAEAMAALRIRLEKINAPCQPLNTSHAFHSKMMDPILDRFALRFGSIAVNSPRMPYLSNVTGQWITAPEAASPKYWSQHLRRTVRFSSGLSTLLQEPDVALLEIGPGRTLASLALRHPDSSGARVILSSLPHHIDRQSDEAFLMTTAGRLWLSGVAFDGRGFYRNEKRRVVSLPFYPFERQRYWIDPPALQENKKQESMTILEKKPDIADWFYLPSWKQTLAPESCNCAHQRLLLFTDENTIMELLIKRLQAKGAEVIRIKSGNRFNKSADGGYILNPDVCGDYVALLDDLIRQDIFPDKIVHAWLVDSDKTEKDFLKLGFYSLIYLAQALGELDIDRDMEIAVLSNNMHEIGGESAIYPQKAAALGPVKVIPQEYPRIRCRSVDMLLPSSGDWREKELADRIAAEIISNSNDRIAAYRNHHRWIASYEPVHLPAVEGKTRLRHEGVYLITGGLGGLGLAIAEHLATTQQAKLILIGRSEFPSRETWRQWLAEHNENDGISRKIRRLQTMEDVGAKILILRADAGNAQQMAEAIRQAKAAFGPIHGVFHAAGVPSGGMIQRRTREAMAKVLAPKIEGTAILADLFKNDDLDFLVLFSSVTAILEEFGQADYCAANAFMDAFASQFPHAVSINWDTWREAGMAQNAFLPQELRAAHAERLKMGIFPHEGIDALDRILASGLPRAIVSTCDFESRMRQYYSAAIKEKAVITSAHARPSMSQPYAPPGNEIEQTLCGIWKELLGIDGVGVHDDFFELGGHSLLASQALSRMRQAFGVRIPLNVFFTHPTIAQLSQQIIVQQAEQMDSDILEQILSEVEETPVDPIKQQALADE
ncbi:MAG: amino acid adenylation domain-containing protein [Candidatus Omnitrophota bacterium]